MMREREREYEKYERDNVVMMCAHERESGMGHHHMDRCKLY
jgi:hypothetical protein